MLLKIQPPAVVAEPSSVKPVKSIVAKAALVYTFKVSMSSALEVNVVNEALVFTSSPTAFSAAVVDEDLSVVV